MKSDDDHQMLSVLQSIEGYLETWIMIHIFAVVFALGNMRGQAHTKHAYIGTGEEIMR